MANAFLPMPAIVPITDNLQRPWLAETEKKLWRTTVLETLSIYSFSCVVGERLQSKKVYGIQTKITSPGR